MLRLSPQCDLRLSGLRLTLRCDLGALYRFEARLGYGLHDLRGRDPARVGRTMLWAMTDGLSETAIGTLKPAEFVQAIEQALLLLASSAFRSDREKRGDGETSPKPERTNWHELWAIGRHDLQLSENEFWSLTPAMFSALCDRLEVQRDHAEYCAGMTAAQVYNANRGEGDAVDATAFMSERWRKAGEHMRAKAQAEALRGKLRDAMAILGARIVEG